MKFGSVGNVVTIPDNDSLEGMAQLTLSAWVYPKVQGTYGRIIEKGNGTPYGFAFTSSNRLSCNIGAESAITLVNSLVGKYNSWHLVNCIYDGSNVLIYIDGVLSASVPKAGIVSTGLTALTIGNNVAGDRTYEGRMDEVRIYNRALSEQEISQLYNVGTVEIRK